MAASLIIRPYSQSRMEPEFRIRLGDRLSTGTFQAGLNLGFNYPLSLKSGPHASLYGEVAVNADTSTQTGSGWAAFGWGYHF